MSKRAISFVLLLLIGFMLIMGSVYTVDQRHFAVVKRLGRVVAAQNVPGVYLKTPFIDEASYFDKRVLTLEGETQEPLMTLDKKNVLVGYFVQWQIVDPLKYALRAQGNEVEANHQLMQIIQHGLNTEIAQLNFSEVISGDNHARIDHLRKSAEAQSQTIGIVLRDVRIQRLALPDSMSHLVYERMAAESKNAVKQLRSEGEARNEKIRADADRQREIIITEAYKDAQHIKGEGDNNVLQIYANTYGKNARFYGFCRDLEMYQNRFKNNKNGMPLDPNSEFLKFIKSAKGAADTAKLKK
jgi:modulator of FtsH protease HflC